MKKLFLSAILAMVGVTDSNAELAGESVTDHNGTSVIKLSIDVSEVDLHSVNILTFYLRTNSYDELDIRLIDLPNEIEMFDPANFIIGTTYQDDYIHSDNDIDTPVTVSFDFFVDPQVSAVPEPSTIALGILDKFRGFFILGTFLQ